MIHLTDKAASQIKTSARDGKMEGQALRIAVMRKDDDSFHYAMGFDTMSRDDDLTFKSKDVDIVVSSLCFPLLKDMTVDFVEIEADQFRFIFMNPNDPAYVPPSEEDSR